MGAGVSVRAPVGLPSGYAGTAPSVPSGVSEGHVCPPPGGKARPSARLLTAVCSLWAPGLTVPTAIAAACGLAALAVVALETFPGYPARAAGHRTHMLPLPGPLDRRGLSEPCCVWAPDSRDGDDRWLCTHTHSGPVRERALLWLPRFFLLTVPSRQPWHCPRCPPMDAVGSVRAACALAADMQAHASRAVSSLAHSRPLYTVVAVEALLQERCFPRANLPGGRGGELRCVRLSPGKCPPGVLLLGGPPPTATYDGPGRR